MMEHYDEWSLPIFPMENHFSSSFVSLGDTAYFITYDKDRPAGMPPICLFSELNHPPRRDFIKHLPYSKSDSDQLGGRIQGYSFWTSPHPDQPPVQVGVKPDRTADGCIMFGYAFESEFRPDSADTSAPPYRHPQSFYFSGFPGTPPNAPIVTQIYTEFAMVRPDPKETWISSPSYLKANRSPNAISSNRVDRVRHRMHRHSQSRQRGPVMLRTELSMGASERAQAGGL